MLLIQRKKKINFGFEEKLFLLLHHRLLYPRLGFSLAIHFRMFCFLKKEDETRKKLVVGTGGTIPMYLQLPLLWLSGLSAW